MAACIDVMADALRSVAAGDAMLPLRTVLRLGTSTNAFATMPAVLGHGDAASIGAKIITVFPGNDATPFDSHIGVVLLFDGVNGSLLAIADASSITAIRTAAVSGLSARLLANDDASELAILGAGVLGLPHLDAMCAVRPIRRLRIWSRSGSAVEGRAQQFAARARAAHDIDVVVCETVAEAVDGAHIVCTITSSRTPVLEGAWLSPGTHICAVGASLASARELDSAAVQRARLFVDRRESAYAEAGDFLVPRGEGLITDAHILGELGQLAAGLIAGRLTRDEITLFKSLGLAVEDVAALRYILARAVETGAGMTFSLGGLRH
jgi:ornithine cyclodeaminase